MKVGNGCDGKCIKVCECVCVEFSNNTDDLDIIIYTAICTCGHRDHKGICTGIQCCLPVECRRCLREIPNYQIRYFEGLCKICRLNGDIFTCPMCENTGYEYILGNFEEFKGTCKECYEIRLNSDTIFKDNYYRSYLANDDLFFLEMYEKQEYKF